MNTLTHPLTGKPLPPIITTAVAAEILGEHRDTVIDQCRSSVLPTMPRSGSGPWQIITAKLLRQLGLLPDTISPDPTSPPPVASRGTKPGAVVPTATAPGSTKATS
jgi:hypothetical protein